MQCTFCKEREATGECKKCKTVAYCSRACQEKDWLDHQLQCELKIGKADLDQTLDDWVFDEQFWPNMQLSKHLGMGRFSNVYKGKYKLKTTVAVKIIQKLEGLANDVTILKKLKDSNFDKCSKYTVCYMFHVLIQDQSPDSKDGDYWYAIVTTYVNGYTIDEIPLEENVEWKDLLLKALRALKFIHASNVIHADIKPENVMFDKKTRDIVLIDFGLACIDSCDTMRGSPAYIAPEVSLKKIPPTQKSDVFSLGAVFWEFITKRESEWVTLVDDELRFDLLMWHDSVELLKPMVKPRDDEYGRILIKMLSPGEKARPTAAEAVKRLKNIKQTV